MTVDIIDVAQGTPEWHAARAGHATSSEFAAVLAKAKEKGGVSKTRAAYMRRILAERITGKAVDTWSNDHMRRGIAQEPLARAAYEVERGVVVREAGFIRHGAFRWCGCSPDGLVGEDGGIEAKCVIPDVQLETVMDGKYPSEHTAQVQGCMWVTGRQWWDFVSFSPDMPEHLRLHIYRVARDEVYIKVLANEVRAFLAEAEMQFRGLMGLPLLTEADVASGALRA